MLNADLRVVSVNREFLRVFGYTSAGGSGPPLNELIVPAELRDEGQRYTELLRRGQPRARLSA